MKIVMRVKICGVQNAQELAIAVQSGADAIGFQVGQIYASKHFILPSTARRLIGELPVWITPILVTQLTTATEIMELVSHSGIDSVQLSKSCPVAQIVKLRDMLSTKGKIIYTDFAHNPTDEMVMAELLPIIDALNLDCYNVSPELVGIESSQKSYLWEAGQEHICNGRMPVIISGRLSGANVQNAIMQNRAFGVDACSLLRDESGTLDAGLAKEFVYNSKREF